MQKIIQCSLASVLFITIGAISACGGGGGKSSGAHSSESSTSIAISTSSSSLSLSSASSSFSDNHSSSSFSADSVATITSFIVVDQFGYLPNAEKVAVIRNPQAGYDAAQSFTPSANVSLVDMNSGEVVFTAAATAWKNGTTDSSSGDKAWWFDFSSVKTPGIYAVVDSEKEVRSPSFKIAADVYKPVLYHAFRTMFYQRAGFAKQIPYADAAWIDAASHIKANQDTAARLYSDKNNAATAKDLSGGWYDAGDYNKYTSWTAEYVTNLLHAYIENPAVWGDDFNIPESGNGIPDILDEVKWGLDWLIKMQDATGNGSVLSIVGLSHTQGSQQNAPGASPPSSATEPSYYGSASTSATMSTAAAFAFASKILAGSEIASFTSYAQDLQGRAEKAWNWAVANPNVLFYNNDASQTPSTADLGAGQQETDDDGRASKKRIAAIYLFAATGKNTYRDFIDANYSKAPLKLWNNFADPFRETENATLLYYTGLSGATTAVVNDIKSSYASAMASADNWQAIRNNADPYRAYLHIDHYTWGSNSVKSLKGRMFTNLLTFSIANTNADEVRNAALRYINYLHGVNPQAKVYLSNMYSVGVHNSVNEFYHSWFSDGSQQWDSVLTSVYGPAPGFLVGGPNPSYDWDGNCTGDNPSSNCGNAAPTPPKGQPAQKAYKDFNTSWPINSWSVTENSNGYQTNYLRLLSQFVNVPE